MVHFLFSLIFLPLVFAECPEDTVQWPTTPPSYCFSFLLKPLPFNEAEKFCTENGGHLTSLHEGFTNSFLTIEATSYFQNSESKDFWIGVTKSSTSGNWSWTDGTEFDFSEWKVQGNESKICGAMGKKDGWWNSVDCEIAKPYVCKNIENSTNANTSTSQMMSAGTTTPLPVSYCPDDWSLFDETQSCYYWTDTFNWSAAEAFCVQQNSHLVSIHTDSELQFTKSIYNGNFWIGLYTNDGPVTSNTTWQWTDGSNVDFVLWDNPLYADHVGMHCVRQSPNFFNDVSCSDSYYAFCKKPALNPVTTTVSATLTTPKPSKCSQGYKYFNLTNACYFLHEAALNWTQAENYCFYNGGHMTSIHSMDEIIFIHNNFFDGGVWVGLYSTDDAIQWKWSDGTPFDYRIWADGYPIRGGSLCGSLWGVSLFGNSYSCSDTLMPVCKHVPLF